jgi:hypothetical protein
MRSIWITRAYGSTGSSAGWTWNIPSPATIKRYIAIRTEALPWLFISRRAFLETARQRFAALLNEHVDLRGRLRRQGFHRIAARADRIITMGSDVEGVPRVDDDCGLPDPKGC